MADPYLQQLFADRIGGSSFGKDTAVYKFAKIKQAKKEATEAHPETALIDMGVGEPDEMAYPEVVAALQHEAALPENRGYADNGNESLKGAAAQYMERVFGVTGIDPQREVLHSIGSKTALTYLAAALINPGDVALLTSPGYPVFGTHARYFGGEVHHLPLEAAHNFLPDLRAVPADQLERAKVLVLNYPNNPTGASATEEFYREVVAFAREHGLVVIQDAAYAALVFDEKPLSLLQVPGGKEVGVELHSLSKSFNMTGWRIGFVVGNERLVQAYGHVKDNSDSGQFLGIQKAAEVALANPWITEEIARKYSRRMDLLVKALRSHGFTVEKPAGSFFLYVPCPTSAVDADGRETTFASAEEFSQWLIRNELVSTVPWDEVGAFVRFSVTFAAPGEANEQRIVEEISARLGKYSFRFEPAAVSA